MGSGGVRSVCELVKGGRVQQLVELLSQGHIDLNKACEMDKVNPLGLACSQGNLEMVTVLLDHGADVNWTGPDGRTSLHHISSVEERRPEVYDILSKLLDHGANVDAVDNMGATALFVACEADDVKMVERLIHAGANVNAQTVCGDSPLKVACRNAEFWFFWHGRENSVATTSTAKYDANCFPPVEITKLLLQAKASAEGVTLIPTAVQCGAISMVLDLLQLGMDVNVLDDNQRTPLGSACTSNAVGANVVELLLTRGADVNKGGGWKKQKPLIFAFVHNSVEKIKLLLSYGAELSPEEMTDIVSLSLTKAVLENPEVIDPSSKELTSWRLLLASGFQPLNQGTLVNKIQRLSMCSSYGSIAPWIQTLLFPLRSLRDCCRIAIRHSLRPSIDAHVTFLPLPPQLKDFLTFKEFTLNDPARDCA